MVSRLENAIKKGRELGKQALYFGCWDGPGHYLYTPKAKRWVEKEFPDLPWNSSLMDSGLLKNGEHPDICDGKVFWTAGGLAFWYAFFWWDRSVDSRGASNSGFYVRGFGWPESQEAFNYACEQFPQVISRQKYPLILQDYHF